MSTTSFRGTAPASLNTRLLRWDTWYSRLPNGTLRLKRVSEERAAKFPKHLREQFRCTAAGLTKHLMDTENIGLAAAWKQVKEMVNS